MRIFLILIFLISFSTKTDAQESINQKMVLNNIVNPTTNLFVHFDKNIYSNNETVYFTAYILKTGKFDLASHKILAVALIKDLDTAFVKAEKFLIQGGLAFGSLTIPDSIITGNYHLLAFTDKLVNGEPELTFKQPIVIKTNIDPPFKASITFQGKPDPLDREHRLIISVTSKDNKFLPKPTTINYRYGNQNKTGKTDLMGQLVISVPKAENLADPNIYIKLKTQKDSSFLAMPLAPTKLNLQVKFYPEGGNLVNNINSVVGWEVTDQQRMPIPVTAFLYKDNAVIDTIQTNSYGIGKFYLTPEENANYSVKLANSSITNSIYKLPKALENGLVINLENAVVQDTLKFTLKNTGDKKVLIRVHNYKNCFVDVPFDMETTSRKIKIPLTDIPKGIQTITVTDSLDRPLAERLFFAHYDEREAFTIQTDSSLYRPRQKVNLKLSPKTLQHNAVVSIAVSQENRYSSKNNNDIESYAYLKNEIENIPVHPNSSYYKDQNYLQQILLVRGWRRYTWQQTESLKLTDTLKKIDSLNINGIVTKYNKELKLPLSLTTFGDHQLREIKTNNKGRFGLTNPTVTTEYDKRIYLFLNIPHKEGHEIKIIDNFDKTGLQLSKKLIFDTYIVPTVLLNNADLVLNKNEKAIRLNEVIIKSTKDNSFNYTGEIGKNACGDYVCLNDILNCRNHANEPNNTKPVKGKTYKYITYQGCILEEQNQASHYIEFTGVRHAKEFYLDDYKDPMEPAFFSTIYWNYATILEAKKETELSFYTSDITGRFKVVVQGAALNDVVYAEKYFDVKK